MKLKLLPLAIGAAIAMPGVAMAETNFYGKLNVAYGMADIDPAYGDDSADHWELTSYDSRFGVKGAEDINDSLKAIYQIEWGVDIDGGSADMSQRDRFVGFQGGFGTFKAGRFDTPLKKAQGKIDLFGDTTGDIKYVFAGENRINNILQYSSPDMGGVQVNVAFAPGEEDEVNNGSDANDGPADSFSVSVTFNADNIYAAIAHDSEVAGDLRIGIDTDLSIFTAEDLINGIIAPAEIETVLDATRLVGVFSMDAFQVGVMYQMAETSDADLSSDIEQDGFLVSGSFKIDAVKLKAQYGSTSTDLNDFDLSSDAELLALGADYGLSKQTNLYAHYTMLSYEFDFAGAEEQTYDKFDLGVVHKF